MFFLEEQRGSRSDNPNRSPAAEARGSAANPPRAGCGDARSWAKTWWGVERKEKRSGGKTGAFALSRPALELLTSHPDGTARR